MRRRAPIAAAVALFAAGAIAAVAGCGGEGGGKTAGASSLAEVKPDLSGADPRLKEIFAEAGKLLPGGRDAYDRRVEKLKGLPIVVNKWGSWCGPCRNEFPFFQAEAKELGGEIAFLGVNVLDTRQSAGNFLRERPVPYPSYIDDTLEIAKLLPPLQGAPATGFYSADGTLTHVKAGEYSNAEQLRQDIRTYALAADSRNAR